MPFQGAGEIVARELAAPPLSRGQALVGIEDLRPAMA